MTTVILSVLIPLAFAGGFAIRRPARTKFDMSVLPDPRDERWQQRGERAYCGACNRNHAVYTLGNVKVENGCGFFVGTQWHKHEAYALAVGARQSERLALESWS